MATKVITKNAQLHWLSAESKDGLLTKDQGCLYIPKLPNKLGQITAETYAELSPKNAIKKRYAGFSSQRDSDMILEDIIVFDKIYGVDNAYDEDVRELVHKLKSVLGFDALYKGYQIESTNSEELINYNRKKHLDILLNVCKQYFGLEEHYNLREDFLPRFGQDTAISDAVFKLTTLNQALLAAYTAFGKTVSGLEIAHRAITSGGIVLVTTPITDTINGFKEELDPLTGKRFGNNPSRKTSYITSADFLKSADAPKKFVKNLKKRADSGELIFILLTVQDLRYQDQNTIFNKQQRKDIRKKYNALSGSLTLWIRDERHTEYEGEVTSEAFGLINCDMILDLTATPYKIADRYSPKHIVDRSLMWAIKHRIDTKIPMVLIDIMHSAFDFLPTDLQNIYDTEEGWNPKKFFEAISNGNGISFSQIRGITELFNKAYLDTKSKKKNPITISNDITISETSKDVGLWVLPQGNGEIGSKEYMPVLAEILNTISDNILVIDSYTLDKQARGSIGNYVEELKKNQRVVILTCEKFLTGTNIPSLGHIVLMRSIGDISQLEQLIGRMVRIYKPNEDNDYFGVKTTVKLYNYCPGMEVKNTLAKWAQAETNLTATTNPQEFLDCISITEYKNGKATAVDAAEIIKVYQDNMKNISGAPVNSIENAICTSGATGFFNGVDLLKKDQGPTTTVSDDNGSKVKEPNNLPKKPKAPSNKKVDDKSVANNINVILKESIAFAYSHNVWDPVKVLMLPELALLIESNNINALINAIKMDVKLESIIRKWYLDVNTSIYNLPVEDVYDKIFTNSKLKKSLGLVYVCFDLARELSNHVTADKYNRILIVNALNGVLPIVLRELNPDVEIVCAEVFDYFNPHLTKLGFTVVEWESITEEDKMKFDNIVMNPPYADGSKLLYTYFFEKALRLSDNVISVMPLDLTSNHDKLKKHNVRIHKHNTMISENVSHYFKGIGLTNIHYVIADATIENIVPEKINPLDTMPLLLPKRERLITIKGDTDCGQTQDDNGIEIIDKVYKGDIIQTKLVPEKIAAKSNKYSAAPWLVFVNHTPSKGRFNCQIAKNNSRTWSMWIFAFEAQSKKEALALKEWLQSETIVNEINKMFDAKGVYTISKEMIDRLPNVK